MRTVVRSSPTLEAVGVQAGYGIVCDSLNGRTDAHCGRPRKIGGCRSSRGARAFAAVAEGATHRVARCLAGSVALATCT